MMFVTRKVIHRRAILRGVGTALALPLLDSMVPPLGAAPAPVKRFGAVYVPNGIEMGNWTPSAEGSEFELTPILQPLAPFRRYLLVLSGLNSTPPPGWTQAPGAHGRASTRFLTDIQPKPTLTNGLEAGISMDQIAAGDLGQETQLRSLELGLDSSDTPGEGDPGYSRAYTSTIAWRSATTPLPIENDPRAVFERLFGDSTSTDPADRLSRIRQDKSILDAVTDKVSRLRQRLGAGDQVKLDEYLEGLREAERRIQTAEERSSRDVEIIDRPDGIPNAFAEHAKLMYDLCVLAYRSDLTRVMTFMISREFSGRTYPELGVRDAHHPISHHQNYPERLASLVKINTYHLELFAYFLEKLRAAPDGDGSLLDHLILVYGAGMSDGNAHSPTDLPILVLGGSAGRLKGGRHIRYPKATPLANLHLALLDRLGVPIEKIGDSTGELKDLG